MISNTGRGRSTESTAVSFKSHYFRDCRSITSISNTGGVRSTESTAVSFKSHCLRDYRSLNSFSNIGRIKITLTIRVTGERARTCCGVAARSYCLSTGS